MAAWPGAPEDAPPELAVRQQQEVLPQRQPPHRLVNAQAVLAGQQTLPAAIAQTVTAVPGDGHDRPQLRLLPAPSFTVTWRP